MKTGKDDDWCQAKAVRIRFLSQANFHSKGSLIGYFNRKFETYIFQQSTSSESGNKLTVEMYFKPNFSHLVWSLLVPLRS